MIYRSRQAPAALRTSKGGRQLWPERPRLSWWKVWGAKKRHRSLVPSKSTTSDRHALQCSSPMQFPCQILYSLQNRSEWPDLPKSAPLLFLRMIWIVSNLSQALRLRRQGCVCHDLRILAAIFCQSTKYIQASKSPLEYKLQADSRSLSRASPSGRPTKKKSEYPKIHFLPPAD